MKSKQRRHQQQNSSGAMYSLPFSFSLVLQFFVSVFWEFSVFQVLVYADKHISRRSHLFFFGLDLCDVYIVIYFPITRVLYPSLQFALSHKIFKLPRWLHSQTTQLSFFFSNAYYISWVYMNISAVCLCETFTTSMCFSSNLLFSTSDFQLLYLYEFCT